MGIEPNAKRIKNLLESIEFKVDKISSQDGNDRLDVTAPTFRVDISRPEDLMEEVARLSGYNNIPTSFPEMPAEARTPARRLEFRNRLKRLMNGFGFTETITYSFDSELSRERLRLKKKDPVGDSFIF